MTEATADDRVEDGGGATRLALQRVATHVLARARFDADGRFGLRVTTDGIGTPAFGSERNVLRIVGAVLVHETRVGGAARSRTIPIAGHSLYELARFAGVNLAAPFSVGHDTPEIGDQHAPIALDPRAATALLAWFRLGWEALDEILPEAGEPSVMQLWPEHFDLAIDAATTQGRVNLGASPGDGGHPEPYLYVGPWEPIRPGEPSFWNAPFGAVLGADAVLATPDPTQTAAAFLRRGLALLA